MHTIKLIALGLDRPDWVADHVPQPGRCCVTGEMCDETLPRALGVKPSFTNLDVLKAPDSQRISVDAAVVMNHRPARSCWIACEDGFHELKGKREIRAWVFHPPEPDEMFAGYATTSYKKHGALRAPLNRDGSNVWLFEMLLVDCSDEAKVQGLWAPLREAQDRGFPRQVLETHQASPDLIAKLGIPVWVEFLRVFGHLRTDPLYQFLCYLLPSQEELKTV